MKKEQGKSVGKTISLKPSDALSSTFFDYVKSCKDNDEFPAIAGRSTREHLRVSHGDTVEPLPMAVESLRRYHQLSQVETIQYLTKETLSLILSHPTSKECVARYEDSLDKAKKNREFKALREKGAGYSINRKSEHGMTLWAFSEKVAEGLEGVSPKVGMFVNHVVQVFMCGVLLRYQYAFEPEQVAELRDEWNRGLTRIAVYSHILDFDVLSVNYNIM